MASATPELPALVRADLALGELKRALADIRDPHPAYAPGYEPSALNNCKQLIEALEYGLKQLTIYLGLPDG